METFNTFRFNRSAKIGTIFTSATAAPALALRCNRRRASRMFIHVHDSRISIRIRNRPRHRLRLLGPLLSGSRLIFFRSNLPAPTVSAAEQCNAMSADLTFTRCNDCGAANPFRPSPSCSPSRWSDKFCSGKRTAALARGATVTG